MATRAKAVDAALEAQIEKFRPKRDPDAPASGGTLWHLNTNGLISQAILLEAGRQHPELEMDSLDDYQGYTISKQVAWEVMADAQRRGMTF